MFKRQRLTNFTEVALAKPLPGGVIRMEPGSSVDYIRVGKDVRGLDISLSKGAAIGKLTVTGSANGISIALGESAKAERLSVHHEPEYGLAAGANSFSVGGGSYIKTGAIRFTGRDNSMIFRDRAYVLERISLSCRGYSCKIDIGEGASIREANIEAAELMNAIHVGRDNMWSTRISIFGSDQHPIFSLAGGERLNPAKSVRIGDHVWIGENSTILKGACIADGCVIASGSLVTKDFSDHPDSVIGGVNTVLKREIRWRRDMAYSSEQISLYEECGGACGDPKAAAFFNEGCSHFRAAMAADGEKEEKEAREAIRCLEIAVTHCKTYAWAWSTLVSAYRRICELLQARFKSRIATPPEISREIRDHISAALAAAGKAVKYGDACVGKNLSALQSVIDKEFD